MKAKAKAIKKPLVPIKIRDGLYKVIYNSKKSTNKSQPSIYSQSASISVVISTTVFSHNLIGSFYSPLVTTTSVIFINPVTNTISNKVVVTVYVTSGSRQVTVSPAPTPAYTVGTIAVFVPSTNTPVVNMNSTIVSGSSTIPLIATTNMSSVSVGDIIHFGNDPTAILPSTIVSVAPDLLSIVISDSRTLPVNTVLTFIKTNTPPIMTFKNNCDYQMDYNLMEKGKYKCNYNFEMFYTNWGPTAYNSPVQIYLNMGVNINNYEAGNPNFSNNINGTSSNYIGFAYVLSNYFISPYMTTTSKSNCEFFIERVPSSNTTTNISLYGIPFLTPVNLNIYNKTLWSAGSGCLDYVLTVTFEKLPETQLPFYNIIFNSRYAQTPVNTNTPVNIIQSFNWDVLPAGRYKCSYSAVTSNVLASATNGNGKGVLVNMLYSNLPLTNTFECGNEDGSIRFSNQSCMGLFYNYVLGSANTTWWLSYLTANFPFIISRPQNNNVQFLCLGNTDKIPNVLSGSQFPHYTLILHMELLKD